MLGTATGVPFGRYRYTGRLRAVVAGVPVVVPLAWWGMAVPAWEAASAALGGCSRPAGRIALGAVALTAWDLFLDPQMTAEDYWRWQQPGAYRGIPLSNYAGWLLTSAAVMAMLEPLLPTSRATACWSGSTPVWPPWRRSGSRPSSGTDSSPPSAGRPCCRSPPWPLPAGAMAERPPIVVIGAGVGGLAAAIRLAAVGHRVVVLERHANVGGKLQRAATAASPSTSVRRC